MEQNEARRLELVENRQSQMEQAVAKMAQSAQSMAESVSQVTEGMKKLIELEVQHGETRNGLGRAFTEIKAVGDRVDSIEREMPTLKLSRFVVAMCVGGILVIAGHAIWNAAFPARDQVTHPAPMVQGQHTGP